MAQTASNLEAYVLEKTSSRFNYVAGYFSNSAIVAWLVWRALLHPARGAPLSPTGLAVCAGAGLFAWSFVEYWLHRWLYHHGPAVFRVGHGLHHERPTAWLGVPYYLTAPVVIGLYEVISRFLDAATVAGVMASTWLGYIGYCAFHHADHHWMFRGARFRRLRLHHLLHHKHEDQNFGIVSTLWDRVFGTYITREGT